MTDGVVGRMLVASLHQGIVDLHPTRLEFYEGWLNPSGLRDGRIGLAPLAAVLSFLRQEGEPYDLVSGRAGEYTAEWTILGLTPFHRAALRRVPPTLRARLALRVARSMVHATSTSSRAVVRWRKGRATMDIRGSILCDVRERTAHPLCEYYASAIRRLMTRFDLDADVATEQCRATGGGHCVMSISMRTEI
jgi:hypothetical protein